MPYSSTEIRVPNEKLYSVMTTDQLMPTEQTPYLLMNWHSGLLHSAAQKLHRF